MQLSKREFSKLPKKEQQALMRVKAPRKKQQSSNPRKNLSPGNQRKRGASVAAAYSTPVNGRNPVIKANRDSCNIKHKEFIGNITGSVAFAIQQFLSVNPGLSATFPWLSVMAQAWEEYRFRSLRFVYKTRTGSTTIGSIIMAPDYDSSDAQPLSEQVLTTYAQVVEDAPWKDITCVLKTSNENPLGRRHFIRTGALAANLDIKTYDIANFVVATVDASGAVPFGKLWVEYDVDFFIPQLPPTGLNPIIGGLITSAGTRSAANPLGDTPVLDGQSLGFAVSAASVITFNSIGTVSVAWDTASNTTLSAMTITPGGGAAGLTSNVVILASGVSGSRINTYTVVAGSTLTFAVTAADASASTSHVTIGVAPTGSFV